MFAFCSVSLLKAQEITYGYFNHIGAGVSIGLDGIGIDASAPIGEYVQMRAGISFLPSMKIFGTDFDYRYGQKDPTTGRRPKNEVDVDVNVGWFNGKMLFDVYPFKDSDFHLTAGLFAGTRAIAEACNKSPILSDEQGINIGDEPYFPDDHQNGKIELRTNVVKPYVGLGYGRDVPRTHINLSFDMGVMFWGKPTAWVWGKESYNSPAEWEEFDANKFDNSIQDAVKTIGNIKIAPILNMRLGFRIL
ncbi:MAG: hypothetical protein K6A32_06940 [Bacteroidales bacterium]|nr:hypothetical protein [Bacteroidales bacterium]